MAKLGRIRPRVAKACLRTRCCLKIESEAFIERRTRPTLDCHRPPPGRRIAPPDDRLQRAIQYSTSVRGRVERSRRTGYPAFTGRLRILCAFARPVGSQAGERVP